jgi:spore germination cell wall hydrolase CwlJ-like protein
MLKTVRAAAVAVALFAFGAFAVSSDPLEARLGESAAVATPWFAHESAAPAVSDLGLNDDAAVATPQDAVAALPALDAEVAQYAASDPDGAEEDCLANAVYFEARGESLEGQLAVAEVVMNRAASGRYPASLCAVVRQPAQFSFVRGGRMPRADRASQAWRRAVGIARVARAGARRMLAGNVLWYHANYVSPGWGRRLSMTDRIGAHVFYR